MSKDYFFRVIIELDEEDPADRSSHAFDFQVEHMLLNLRRWHIIAAILLM